MAMKNKKGFTLVELLAVIVILAVILVIAVPSITSTITESRKGALASSAKLIASSAETAYISNQTLGIEKNIRCEDVSSYNSNDDFTCDLQIEDGKAKVTLIGKGKFEGMRVCSGTKEDAETIESNKCPVKPKSFSEDSWETISEAVKDGNTSKYHVGDTKTIDLDINGDGTDETYTLRIANMSACPTGDKALASETACGFVIEFADIITTHVMNDTETYAGGWPASTMRKYLNDLDDTDETDGVIYNALVSAIGDTNGKMIIDTTVVSSYGRSDSVFQSNYTSIDQVYLLSTREVYGKEGTSGTISEDSADGDTITRQLDYYATYANTDGTTGVTTSKYAGAIKNNGSTASYWWLRSAVSAYKSIFAVNSSGNWIRGIAPAPYGVSPAFRLG